MNRKFFRPASWVVVVFSLCLSHPANADVVSIMPFGDSITSGYHGLISTAGSYREEIQKMLAQDDFQYDMVGNYQSYTGGYDGDYQAAGSASIEFMTDNFASAVAQHQPDFILVLAGTNNHFEPPDFTSFVQTYDNLANMILANAPSTHIIFSTLPKFGYDPYTPPGGVPPNYWSSEFVDLRNTVTFPNMNNAIRAVASMHADSISVVDLFSIFDPATDLSRDAVHPNIYGHQKLAKLFHDEIVGQIVIAGVPEPGSGLALSCITLCCFAKRRRQRNTSQPACR